jgi:hypothetical protein
MNKYFKENGSKLLEEILASEEEGLDGGTVFSLHKDEKFYFHVQDMYVAVDNSDCQCYVEEFNTSKEAIDWLKEYEVEEDAEDQV